MNGTTQNLLKLLIFLALLAFPSLTHAQCASFTPNLDLGLPTVSSIGWGPCVNTKRTDFGAVHINDSGTALNASEPLNLDNQRAFGNAAKVASTSAIEYAASGGNDSDDGLSWGTAKLTVMAAYDALPKTGGTVYICGQSEFGGTVINATSTGQGIWIMGPHDPNYANPPRGWRQAKNASFIGACGAEVDQQGSKPTVMVQSNGTLGPGIWLSNMQGVANLHFENLLLKYYSTAVRIGVDSTGAQTNTSGVYGASFENVVTKMCNPTCTSGEGPGWLIGGGDSADLFFDHIVASGNGQATPGADNQAAMLFKAGSGISGFIAKITDSVVEAGPIKYYEPQGGSVITVKDTYSEGLVGGGTFWAASKAIGSNTTYDIENVFTADGKACGAEFDNFAWHLGNITTINTQICGNAIQQGSFVSSNLGNQTGIIGDPLTQGMNGISYGRYYGFLGNTQREFAPSMVRYQNLAPSASSSWTISGVGGAIATGITAPDGTTGAARVTTTTSNVTIAFYSQSLSLAVGQYFIAGLYQRFNSPDDYYDFNGAGTYGLQITVGGTGNRTACSSLWTPGMATDGWVWVYQICKLTAAPSSPAAVSVTSVAPVAGAHTSALDFYAPMLLNIPPGAISNDEVYELANNLVPYNSSCTVGTLCGITGSGGARRVCDIRVGNQSGSAITNAQLGPQTRLCFIPAAATIVEMDVAADGGTPKVVVGLNHAGIVSNIVSSALATAASGGIACSNTGGTTGIDGATTCSATLQNTSVAAGDYLELVSGTAGGTAKFMTIHVTYTVK